MTGMRHSGNAPKQDIVVIVEWIAFVSHLPSILLTWPFRNSTFPMIFLTPISQVIFLTFLFAFVFRKWELARQRRNENNAVNQQ